jgi:hypothetical protein
MGPNGVDIPRRAAILLIGGDKSPDDPTTPAWNAWYDHFVPIADKLYDVHLSELRDEGLVLMPSTKNFDQLSAAARRDPVRAERIDAAKASALEELARYRLSELRQALGVTQAVLAELIGRS